MRIKRICPKCGEIVESRFCTTCGQDLTGADIVKICPKCGTETDSKFCTSCGTKLFEETISVSLDTPVAVGTDNLEKTEGNDVSATSVLKRATMIGVQKVKDLEKNAEAKRELQREKERQEALEKEEHEKKKKIIQQKKTYEEALKYIETADRSNDHEIAVRFYRKAEEMLTNITGFEDADERIISVAKKAKEHEIIIETDRIKREQEKVSTEEAVTQDITEIAIEDTKKTEVKSTKNITTGGSDLAGQNQIGNFDQWPAESSSIVSNGNGSKTKIIILVAVIVVVVIIAAIFGFSRNGDSGESALSTNETSQSDETVPASKKSEKLPTSLVSKDGLEVVLDDAQYTEGASDIIFSINVKNNTDDGVYVIIDDVVVEDANIKVGYDGSEDVIEGGDWSISREISLEDLQNAEVTDFKKFSCNIIVKSGEKEIQTTKLNLNREDFNEIPSGSARSTVDNSDTTIEISKKNLKPVIAANDKYSIGITECTYTPGASDLYIGYELQNDTKKLMYIYMKDVKIDGSEIKPSFDESTDPNKAGDWYVESYISLDDLKNAGVEKFKEMSFTMVVKVGDKEDLRQKIHITQDGFIEEKN